MAWVVANVLVAHRDLMSASLAYLPSSFPMFRQDPLHDEVFVRQLYVLYVESTLRSHSLEYSLPVLQLRLTI
uniref:Rho-GAP domain-containing protein n=1 Tax=Ascaris lumbricoides TaxID=6252 RepID=A0A0M3HF66_ASCLU